MAALPNTPVVPVEAYLNASYPDGDREYLDGVVVERNVGTPDHSALQKILVVHLAGFEKQLRIAVRPECRTRIEETRYRVPDIVVMGRPFRQTDRVVLDAPLLIGIAYPISSSWDDRSARPIALCWMRRS